MALIEKGGSIDWLVHPADRLGRALRRPAGWARARALAARPRGAGHQHAPLPPRHAGARDRARHRHRHRARSSTSCRRAPRTPPSSASSRAARASSTCRWSSWSASSTARSCRGSTDTGDGLTMIAGDDGLQLHAPVLVEGRDLASVGRLQRDRGRAPQLLARPTTPRSRSRPLPLDRVGVTAPHRAAGGRPGPRGCTYQGEWRDDVRPLAHHAQGADLRARRVASSPRATTSLPEWIGSVRNWDYRYSWLRDATFTLLGAAARRAATTRRPRAWRAWLLRAVAGSTRRLPDHVRGAPASAASPRCELDWLPGYEGSKPVRIGNQATRAVPARRLRRGARRGWTWVGPGSGRTNDAPHRHGQVNDMVLDHGLPRQGLGPRPTTASGRSAARSATSPTRR